MEIKQGTSRAIAAVAFLGTVITTNFIYHSMNYSNILSLSGALFTGVITAGIWLEVSYRFLVKQATAPLDRIVGRQ